MKKWIAGLLVAGLICTGVGTAYAAGSQESNGTKSGTAQSNVYALCENAEVRACSQSVGNGYGACTQAQDKNCTCTQAQSKNGTCTNANCQNDSECTYVNCPNDGVRPLDGTGFQNGKGK